MTMGGYMALQNQWNRFDHRWKKALRAAKIPYFHVKEHDGHPFALKAVRIADDNLMLGFVVRLAQADYLNHYREDSRWNNKVQPDSMYGLCFRYCLSVVMRAARGEMQQQDLSVDFLVGAGHPNSGSAAEIVRTLKKRRIPKISEYLGKGAIGDAKKIPGLQAADGVTSGAWHLEQRGIPVLYPPVDPTHSLRSWNPARTGWKVPILRAEINAAELAIFKKEYFEHFEYRRTWHGKNGADTATNLQDGNKSALTP